MSNNSFPEMRRAKWCSRRRPCPASAYPKRKTIDITQKPSLKETVAGMSIIEAKELLREVNTRIYGCDRSGGNSEAQQLELEKLIYSLGYRRVDQITGEVLPNDEKIFG